MCGIAGFWGPTSNADGHSALVRRMSNRIAHRGPDGDGVWTDPDAEIALAHRRLSIVDLSPAGAQPMVSACGRYVISFNGEIYNHVDLRSSLGRDQVWRGHSDTEVLLAAIARWGVRRALEQSVGMFAFAVWDRKLRTLALARDRLGEKPLYFGYLQQTFVFASELSAFTAHPEWRGGVNRDSLALLMRHNYIPAPHSIYEGISKLGPGQILTLTKPSDQPHFESYWSASAVAQAGSVSPFTGTPDQAVERLEGLLRQSLQGQMMADVPLGAFLSGGVDSSTVVALMQSMSSCPVKTFTIGFEQKDFNEAEQAKAIARHLGTAHSELYVSEQEARDVIPQLPRYYSEPFADASQIPTYLVSRLAKQHVTVSLSGDGGDELFAGYSRYALAQTLWNRLKPLPRWVRRAVQALATTPSPAVYDAVFGAMPYRLGTRPGDRIHKAAGLLPSASLVELYAGMVSVWGHPTPVIGAGSAPTVLTGRQRELVLSSDVQRLMYLDLVSYLPGDILAKVDRASMAVSLESRVPLLDHRVVEFALSLPSSYLNREGETKWPLRQVLYKYVPQQLIERPKMGFGVPIDGWLRGTLRDWAEDLLAEARLKREGYLDPAPIRRVWAEHLSGRRNMQYHLWPVLMFQEWLSQQGRSDFD
ncbi:MAG: asparagine synthase (glutamine-hydrolyzing) [Hyphomicrobium aestuarii]|nr:asparagine synthase (glutamine-hydrolyzing) [Hyphomicrobium aestuarii]